jgi:hypothetical protein
MRQQNPKIINVVFCRTAVGKEPVREWMLKLGKETDVATAKRKPAVKKVAARSKAKAKTRPGKCNEALGSELDDLFGKRLEIYLIDV